MWKPGFYRLVNDYDDTFEGKKIDFDNVFYDHPLDRLEINEATRDYHRLHPLGVGRGINALMYSFIHIIYSGPARRDLQVTTSGLGRNTT